MKKLTKILSVILCLAMVMGLATVAFAEETTPKQITSLDQLVTGTYTIVCANGANLGAYNNGWVTNAESVWTITVDGTNVKLTDANGTSIAPKGGNNNGIKNADYNWTVACDANGLFTFAGQGSDTVMLAYNVQSDGFRAYKTTTINGNTSGYPNTFKIYEATAGEGGEGNEGDDNQEPEQPTGPAVVTIPEAVTIGEANSNYTTEKYQVTGTIALIENAAYGNMYIIDEQGNHLYLYGLNDEAGNRYDAMTDKPDEGDTITVVGPLGNYKGTAQMKPATLVSYTAGEAPEIEELTIPEAIAKAPTAKIYTKYLVRGKIVEVKDITYGNLYIEDEDGNKLYIYGLYSKDGTTRYDKMETKPQVGDEILVLGALTTYNDQPQMKNGWLQEHKEAEEEVVIPDPVEITIPEAIAIGAGQEHNTYTVEKYILTGKIVEITNDKYGNVYIEDAEGNKILVYGLYDEKGIRYDAMDPQPAVGDTITVVGVLGQFNDIPQMKNGVVTEIIPGEPSQTGDPILVAVCAMLVSGGAVAILPKKREF